MTIQEIAKKAKEIRKKHPEYKWTDCIKLASGKKITAGKTEPKRRKTVKAETRSAVSKKKNPAKKIILTFKELDPDTGNIYYTGTDGKLYVTVEGIIHATSYGTPSHKVTSAVIKKGEFKWDAKDRFNRRYKEQNPSEKPADKVFKKFMHKAPDKHQSIDIGPIEKGLALIGKCSRLDYFSDKRIYKTDKELNRDVIREYTHDMVTPCNMYVTSDGKTIVITMKKAVTAAGIIQ